jgi:hypothetical protein
VVIVHKITGTAMITAHRMTIRLHNRTQCPRFHRRPHA